MDGTEHQPAHTVPHHLTYLGKGALGQTVGGKGMVGGCCKVGKGVEERAVKVEDEGRCLFHCL